MAPKISNKLAKHINDLCLNEENADVHFELPISMKTPKLTKRIPAHTLILCGASPPFDAMFSGNWKETANGEDIEVPDMDAETFQRLMIYVYKDEAKISSMDIELVIGLYYAAKKYEVSGLVERCRHYFDGQLNVNDAFTVLAYCLGKDEPELRARTIQLIQRFTKDALESYEFLDASRKVVEMVFSLDELSISEIRLFNAAYEWVKHRCDGSEDPLKLRGEFGSILELIRFPTMDCREFCREVVPTKLFTMAEEHQILLQIGGSEDEPPAKKGVPRFSQIPRSVVEGSQLSVKIDHFPDVVAKGYLAKNNWYGDAVQVCGRRWRLKVHLIGVDLLCPWAQKGNPPKHMDCCLEMLPVVIDRKDAFCYHVDSSFRIIMHTHGVEVDSGESLVGSLTHFCADNDDHNYYNIRKFAACEELLDLKNGYLSADEDQSLEVVANIFVTKVEGTITNNHEHLE